MYQLLFYYYTIPSIIFLSIFYILTKINLKFRRFLLIGYVLMNGIYLYWRIVYSFPTITIFSSFSGGLLLFAEIMGFLQSLVLVILFWSPYRRKFRSLKRLKKLPTVDILIATYNENAEILNRTILGCQNIDYPKHLVSIYLCDDGNRSEIATLAKKFDIGYINRDSNEHAKAGNLNHALTQTTGEIIVTQDADMVPKRHFLKRTLGYFYKEDVGFVQTPQTFFNYDIFQNNLFLHNEVNNEQDFFMRSLQTAKDQYNALLYVGSNALFRRTTLEEIGGFSTGVITEDMATGLIIQNNGWKTVFVNEALASGISPETLEDFIKQRDRWGRGNIQVFKKYKLNKLPELSFIQKLFYVDGVLYWFYGIYKLIYIICPLLYILFNVYSIEAAFTDLLLFWAPSYLSGQLMFKSIAGKKYHSLLSHIYELSTAPQVFWAVFKEVFAKSDKGKKFHVTKKGLKQTTSHFNWRIIRTQIVLLVICLIAFVKLALTSYQSGHAISFFNLNTYWLLYNIFALTIVVFVAIERPRLPLFVKVILDEIINIGKTNLFAEDIIISESHLILNLPYRKKLARQLKENYYTSISFKELTNLPIQKTKLKIANDAIEVTFKINHLSKENQKALHQLIYSDMKNQVGEVKDLKAWRILRDVNKNRYFNRENYLTLR
ncbi:glycosyltransferase [Carnobacterium divergens]|uniref:glycosyltransferase family 2 protein n=1 Tax=Carnobacterium divergens TaxID=2748 RepID=UPI0039B0B548